MKVLVLIILLAVTFTYSQNEPAGKISGLFYLDYFYNVQRDTGISSLPNSALTGVKDYNAFELRRAYFTYDYKISDAFSTRFRLEADGKTLAQNGKSSVFVKDAFLKWKDILPGQDVYLGIQPTPAFDVSESFYGFRSLEKTIMDLRGIVASRDFGISMRGKVSEDLGYWVLFGNNSSNSPETDRYKRLYAHLNYKPVKNVMTTVYADYKLRQKISDPASVSTLINHNVLTTAFFLGYSQPELLSLGTEVVYQLNENDFVKNNVADNNTALGVSAFASYKFNDKLQFTLRYDYFDPSSRSEVKYDSRNYYIFGLSYKPVNEVSIIPNLLVETYEKSLNRSYTSSITPRLTVAYSF